MLTETITILLVEDNSADACRVQEMLWEVETFEFQLIHVSRLAEALTCLTTQPSISIILLDLSLPDAQGLDSVKEVLRVSPDSPIVLMSNWCDEEIALQALQTGVQDYLIKDHLDSHLLVRSVRYAIERQGMQLRLQQAQAELNQQHQQLEQLVYDMSDVYDELRLHKTTEIQLLQAKEAAEAGSRAKSEFLATMSHELRTPLNAVLGLSQLMGQEIFGALNEKQKEYISCIQSSGEHLLSLINDILDLSKVEAGKEQLYFVPLDIHDLCDYCLAMVREQAFKQGLNLTLEIDPQIRICIADERRCKQMLLNLLSNAVKFTLMGEVALIVRKQASGISFTVKDTGIGIPAEKLPLLFEPFRQLDSGLNRQFPGTGLGLALTRSLALLHGGDIKVESTLGQGSQFTLFLSDWSSEELLLPSVSQGLGDCQGQYCPVGISRILLVENDERSALLLKDYLQVIGHKVEHLTDSRIFLDSVRNFQPNLILMDVQLRGDYTGFDLLATLRKDPDKKHLKVVMVTAMAMAGDRERCIEAGADDYLSKPIGIAQLEAILMQYL